MYVGNAMLLILNLPLIGIWVRLLKTPYVILFPLILLFCLVGVYSLNSNVAEIVIMLALRRHWLFVAPRRFRRRAVYSRHGARSNHGNFVAPDVVDLAWYFYAFF